MTVCLANQWYRYDPAVGEYPQAAAPSPIVTSATVCLKRASSRMTIGSGRTRSSGGNFGEFVPKFDSLGRSRLCSKEPRQLV